MIAAELGYKRYFGVQQRIFKLIGIDITVSDKFAKRPLLVWFPGVFVMLLMYCMAQYSWENRGEIDKVTDALTPFAENGLSIWKMLMYVIHQRATLELVRRVWTMSKVESLEERAIIANFNANESLFSTIYLSAVIMTGVVMVLNPLFVTFLLYVRTGEIQLFAPLRGSYFFDYTQPWGCVTLSLWTVINNYFVIFASCALDTLYSWFVVNLVAQLRILQLRLRNAGSLKNTNDLERSVRECIRFHQKIISLAIEVDHTFRPIIFVQFSVSCMQLCLLAFQIVKGSPKENIMYFLTFFAAVSTQMVIYCFGGQMVQNESLNVAENIYKSFPWQHLPARAKKLLLITMLRAQKCCTITGIFFVVDLSLFLWVFKTASSYLTMLWTLKKNASN